jgi:membrane dipeptidase
VGIILGWQNTSGFDDYLPYIRAFRRLGVGIAQLTYNTMNSLGSGCLEAKDHGLSDFGREFVAECNAAGMAIDLSHVGAQTADEVIEFSVKPVTYSHVSPAALFNHARNKSDAQIRKLADRGGLIGVTLHPPFQAKGNDSTLDDYIYAIEHCISVVGENSIAIGTDFVTGHRHDTPEWEYLLRDKGHARRVFEIGEVRHPRDFASVADYPNLHLAMEARGWSTSRIEKILGANWIEFLREAWCE